VRELKGEGQSIRIVDKTLIKLLKVADRCFGLERGQSVRDGTPGNLSNEIGDRYLGV